VNPSAPAQGSQLRIKPGVDLKSLGLSPAALVIAEALQKYGAIVGDSSGGPASLKVENTVAEGNGFVWEGLLAADSLRAIPFRVYEFVEAPRRNNG
jgi:hypothetical protein